VHRRIDVRERPLVGGQLAVRVHVPLAQDEPELFLRDVGIDDGERDAVEGEVPGGVPGILPFVRHQQHVCVVNVGPLMITAKSAPGRRRRLAGVALEPILDHVVVILLRPQQARQRLARNTPGIVGHRSREDFGVVLVSFAAAQIDHRVELRERLAVARCDVVQTQAECRARSGCDCRGVAGCRLGAAFGWIDGVRLAVHDVAVEGVLAVRRISVAEQPLRIGVVLGEHQVGGCVAVQPAPAVLRVVERD
jgi:hypothetical protein